MIENATTFKVLKLSYFNSSGETFYQRRTSRDWSNMGIMIIIIIIKRSRRRPIQ